ncbi:MAG: right-handed parallel beta-helix repeat-containing protein [Candidatus Micrarchaeia archaeon]|jgi:nitrous oxidase accessory protein NosD
MKYSGVFLVLIVLAGLSFAVSLQCDAEISASGTYRPTSDLNGSVGSNCVNISVSNLLIDCNVTGTLYNITGNASLNAFYINNTGLHNITIQNCGIYNFTYGIEGITNGVDGLTVQNSLFHNSSLYGIYVAGENASVTDSTFERNFQGLALEGNYAEASGNTFTNNTYGLLMSENNHSSATYNVFNSDNRTCITLDTQDNLEVQHNNLTSCGTYGVEGYDLLNTEFSNNTILRPWMGGIFVNVTAYGWNSNVDLLDNTVNWSFNYSDTYATAAGIALHNSTGGEVRNNVLANNNGTGLSLTKVNNTEITGNEVRDNQFSTSSHGYGVAILYCNDILFDNNLLEGNGYDASTTGFGGMLLAEVTNGLFSMNNISDNVNRAAGTGVPVGVGAVDLENVTFDGNIINSNNGTGLSLAVSLLTDSIGIVVTDNMVANQTDGVSVISAYSLVLTGNAVADNLAYGARLAYSNSSNIQGNSFYGNGNVSAAALYLTSSAFGRIDNNSFDTNENGLHMDTTNLTNVTDNGFTTNGVGLLDYQSSALYIYGNIFNESTNLTAVGLTSADAVFSNNRVHDNAASGVLIFDSGPVGMDSNIIYNHLSAYAAVDLYNSSSASATTNTMHNNTVAIIVDWSNGFTATGNNLINNSLGFWVMTSTNMTLDSNVLTDNSAWQVYLYNSTGGNITGNSLHAVSIVGVGMFVETTSNSDFSGNTVTGTHLVGYAIADESANNTVTSDTVSGAIMGFLIDNSTNATLVGTVSYGNLFGYEFDDYGNATISDATSYDNSVSCLDVSPGNVSLDNFRMWGCGAYITSDENSSINATDLWLGYDNSYGLLYETIYINVTTVADTDNLLLDRGFVSMNISDANVSALNVSATAYIRPKNSCSALRYYNMSGFPQTQDEIITGGDVFTPTTQACTGNVASFRVYSFSGYTASGAIPSTGGSSTMDMAVSGDTAVGGDVTLTVMAGTTPLSGANVKVFYWLNGILQVEDIGNTNSQGEVTFTPAFAGSYKATATKTGYSEEEARFIVSAAATAPVCISDADCAVGRVCTAGICVIEVEEEPEPAPETPTGTGQPAGGCTADADCAYNEACSGGSCVIVQAGACGEYVNHAWVGFNCCADGDCGVGYACTNYNCVQQPRETEVPAGAGTISMPSSTTETAGTPWALVVVAVILGAAVVWWLFVRKP